jgi:glycosyltransferase involved in cell wall biosynthesis
VSIQPQNLFSIIILSYNAAKYIEQSIASAVSQDWQNKEVIVVDDGSSDNSVELIKRFSQVTLIQKRNGGQASAMNVGYEACGGDYVLFLDGDDFLYPTALTKHGFALATGAVRSQAHLEVVDSGGARKGIRLPGKIAPSGSLREIALRYGPGAVVSTPASGNAWSRAFLQQIMPLPENLPANGDAFIMDVAPLFGEIVTLEPSLAAWREHNTQATKQVDRFDNASMINAINMVETRYEYMARMVKRTGCAPNLHQWRQLNWRLTTIKVLVNKSLSLSGFEIPEEQSGMRGRNLKAVAIAALVTLVKALPVFCALPLARRFIRLRYM